MSDILRRSSNVLYISATRKDDFLRWPTIYHLKATPTVYWNQRKRKKIRTFRYFFFFLFIPLLAEHKKEILREILVARVSEWQWIPSATVIVATAVVYKAGIQYVRCFYSTQRIFVGSAGLEATLPICQTLLAVFLLGVDWQSPTRELRLKQWESVQAAVRVSPQSTNNPSWKKLYSFTLRFPAETGEQVARYAGFPFSASSSIFDGYCARKTARDQLLCLFVRGARASGSSTVGTYPCQKLLQLL